MMLNKWSTCCDGNCRRRGQEQQGLPTQGGTAAQTLGPEQQVPAGVLHWSAQPPPPPEPPELDPPVAPVPALAPVPAKPA